MHPETTRYTLRAAITRARKELRRMSHKGLTKTPIRERRLVKYTSGIGPTGPRSSLRENSSKKNSNCREPRSSKHTKFFAILGERDNRAPKLCDSTIGFRHARIPREGGRSGVAAAGILGAKNPFLRLRFACKGLRAALSGGNMFQTLWGNLGLSLQWQNEYNKV